MKKADGPWGEKQAARYLRRHHYRIAARNFRCRTGEIDIIAEKDGFLVFAEVKLRKNGEHGLPREFVTPNKQKRVRSAAMQYLLSHESGKQPRFDVIEVYPKKNRLFLRAEIVHLEDAF